MLASKKLYCLPLLLLIHLAVWPARAEDGPPQRIVSLKPNITDILVDLGLGERVVGVTKFCKRPHAGAQIVADYNSIQVEEVLRLKPDIIITSSENAQERQYRQLERFGLKLVLLEFRTYDEMIAAVKKIGSLTGTKAKAEAQVDSTERKLASIRAEAGKLFAQGPTFLAVVQRQPLMVAAGQTYISSLFEKAGFRNVFAKNKIRFPLIGPEDFLRAKADYVFDFSYEADRNPIFLTKTVRLLRIEDFLATPASVDVLEKLVKDL